MSTKWIKGALALALTGVVAGCGGPVDGKPTTGGPSSDSATPDDLHGAPNIANPLKVDKFIKHPCAVISDQQKESLTSSIQLPSTGKESAIEGLSNDCQWSGGGNNATVGLQFLQGGGGLSYIYAQRKELPVFEERPPIEGYPVLHEAQNKELPGDCRLVVGVSNHQAIVASYTGGTGDVEPCDAATKLATAAVQTLKAAS
ncbi:DUF3558 domain-containing protein [Sciscionella sediminilitoris]|uniref:DUF3558 domain-containing protein n=1 Tax=Sciscionella sediminilitoris TaxID=1445613 RepID=UPI0009ECABC8|nr:DUF3558 domain-containing protein [Sciscionella sp. SE31]